MEGANNFYPGTRVPINILYHGPTGPGRGPRSVSVLSDVKGVMGHALMGVGLVAITGKAIYDRVPGTVLLAGLVGVSACIAFAPVLAPACCYILTPPALPAAGLTLVNIFGTVPMFMGGGYLLTKLAGAQPKDRTAFYNELPERRLLRRIANLGVFSMIGTHLGLGAIGYEAWSRISLMKSGINRLIILIR